MSDDDFEQHIRAVEAMAKRLSDAANVFREARLMLGGGDRPLTGGAESPAVMSGPIPAPVVSARPPTRTIGDFNGFTQQELAERERLKRRNMGDELPAGIQALEAEQ